MPSSIEPNRSKSSITFEVWNRKLHFYLGLYFLFFLWLFSLTGLLLNHGRWAMALGANQRAETRYERGIEIPAGNTDLVRAARHNASAEPGGRSRLARITAAWTSGLQCKPAQRGQSGARRSFREARLRPALRQQPLGYFPNLSHVQRFAL